jgi:hypothetical protein
MTKLDIYKAAIETAKEELEIAEQNMRYAEPELLTYAIINLTAKKEKINGLIRLAKKELVV